MTAQRLILRRSGGRPVVHSFHFPDFHLRPLSGCPCVCERCRAHQVIRNHAEPDPPSGAVSASIATPPQAVPSFDHTDAAFVSATGVSMRKRRPCVTPARLATSTPRRCGWSMSSGPSARAIFRIVFASGTSPASIRVKASGSASEGQPPRASRVDRAADSAASALPWLGPRSQSRPRPRATYRFVATSRATACDHRAATPRTSSARADGVGPCTLL